MFFQRSHREFLVTSFAPPKNSPRILGDFFRPQRSHQIPKKSPNPPLHPVSPSQDFIFCNLNPCRVRSGRAGRGQAGQAGQAGDCSERRGCFHRQQREESATARANRRPATPCTPPATPCTPLATPCTPPATPCSACTPPATMVSEDMGVGQCSKHGNWHQLALRT